MPAHQCRPAFWRANRGDPRVYEFWGGSDSLGSLHEMALDLGPTRRRKLGDPFWHENDYGAWTTT